MRNTLVVGWKEFRTFFQTPIGYVILVVFTLLGGWFFFSVGSGRPFFIQREASVRGLLTWLPWLFLVFAPAITMRLWAEERRTGTIETLLTLPLTDWQIVVGKYLAACGLVAVWLLCLTPIAGVVAWFGEPDFGPILGGFIGALLLGAAYAAIGVAASSVTENQLISLVLGVAAAFFFLLVGFEPVVALFPHALGGFLYDLSLSTHFHSIARGVLDSRDVLYYASFILFFLSINVWAVRRTPGRGVTIGLIFGISLLVNYLGTNHFRRIDLTENDRYTLSDDTKRILGGLDDDLRLTAYLSTDLPADFTNVRRDIEDLVREFESYAGGHLRVEFVDPGKNEETRKAAEAAGVRELEFQAADASKLEVRRGYLGMVIEFGDKTEKMPAIGSVSTLEYDLVRRMAKMTRREAVKVAWHVNDPYGGMDIPGMPKPPSSDKHSPTTDMRELDQAIKLEYESTTIDLKSKVPDEVKAVILCNVEGLTDVQKFHLDQFLMRGGGLIVLADGTEPMNMGGMGRGGSPFMRTASQKLPDDLFSHYGFKINKDLVVDRVCLPVPIPVQGTPFRVEKYYPAAVVAISNFIDQSHPTSANFKQLGFLFCSSIELDPKPGVKKFELVKSSTHARKLTNFIDVSFERLDDLKSDTFDPETYNDQVLLAGLLEGQFQSYFVAHEVPKEVSEGPPKPGDQASPFGDLPIEDDAVHAKEHDEGGAKPKSGEEKQEPKPDGDPKQTPKPDGDPKKSDDGGGPKAEGADGSDVPGGGLAHVQDGNAAPAPAAAPKQESDAKPPVEGAPANPPAPIVPAVPVAPKKEFEYLKQSTAPGKIFVFGTSEFASDQLVGGSIDNGLFMLGVIDYMASEKLSSLRAKRIDDGMFADPSNAAKRAAWALGWGGAPALLAGLALFVFWWRRKIRPARARRRMAMASAR